MTTGFLTFGVISLCFVLEIDFVATLFLKSPLGYFDGIWLKCRTGRDGVLCTRFLLLVLSPFVMFDSDHALILCLLCKLNTLWNISMILVRNVEQN